MQTYTFTIITWLLVIIATESITEILVDSALFFPIRDKLSSKNVWLATLINCGYCLSVWVSAFFALFVYKPFTDFVIIDYIITLFVIHRLSNIFHQIIHRRNGVIDHGE